jgi:hypothetical protein
MHPSIETKKSLSYWRSWGVKGTAKGFDRGFARQGRTSQAHTIKHVSRTYLTQGQHDVVHSKNPLPPLRFQ